MRATAALVVLLAPALLMAQTPRDTGAPVTAGTAVVSGVVVADDSNNAPVRRAVVTVASPDVRGDRRTVSDDQGRFTIGQLPPGHYTVSAAKAGWLSAYYGSSHPGRAAFGGASLGIKAGEQAPPVTLKLLHGSAITGVVTDGFGRPAAGLEMQLAGVRVQDGERRLVSQNFTGVAGSVNAPTDDRGVYRFYGVAPGDYVIVAMPGFMDFGNSEVQQLTPDALTSARRSVAAAAPGASGAVSNGPAQTAARPPTIGAASVFYPGTVDLATATLVRIGPNEERSGLDFVMQLVPTARVQGIVMGPDGQPSAGANVQLLPPGDDSFMFFDFSTTRTGPDGRFELKGVRPGSYQATARAAEQAAAGRAGGGGLGVSVSTTTIDNGNVIMFNSGPGPNAALWASEAVTVAGQDIPNLTLSLQRGTTVSGRVVFTGTSLQAPQDLSRTRVMLLPAAGNARMGAAPLNAQTDASGAFHMANVPPGRYRANVVVLGPGRGAGAGGGGRGGGGAGPLQMAGAPAASWQLKSVMSGDVDAIDHPIEVTQNAAPADLVATFTDRLGEISGAVRNGAGQPVSDYRIVVFSADKTVWGTSSRRMRAPVQTERDGTFRVENLPAGNYFLAAVTDMDQDDLTNMAFLDDLAKQAIPITLGDGEKKVQEIRVK